MPTSGLDRHDNDGRPDYCCAARRKISIGEYHLECAQGSVASYQEQSARRGRPRIADPGGQSLREKAQRNNPLTWNRPR